MPIETREVAATPPVALPNFLTVLRGPGRDAFVAEARLRPPFYETTSKAWIVAQPDLCRELLTSPDLEPAPAVERYHDFPPELGLDFAAVRFALEHLPLSLVGEKHATARQFMSTFLAGRRVPLARWMGERLPAFLAPFAVEGKVEVMTTVVRPLVRALFEVLIDIDLPAELDLDDASEVFDKAISMRRRRQLEVDLSALLAHIRKRLGGAATSEEAGMRLAILVVGKEALQGTIGEGLASLFRDHPGTPLGEIPFPKMPNATGVPFVERIAVSDLVAAGQHIAKGERVRIVLQTYAFEPPDQHHRFFGAGSHACLGRPASVDAWSAITAHLKSLPTRATLLSFQPSVHSYVFNAPRSFEVEISR